MKFIEDDKQFLMNLRARIEQYAKKIDAGQVSEEFVAFELLCSIFSGHEGGLEAEKMRSAYPIDSWRENNVEIPVAIIRAIVGGWVKYQASDAKLPLGVAYGLEGGGKGKRPMASTNQTLNRDQKLSNEVVLELELAKHQGYPISQDAAIQAVTDREAVGYETVCNAFKHHGAETLKLLKDRE
jgi:hypothetical protein